MFDFAMFLLLLAAAGTAVHEFIELKKEIRK